MPPPTIGDQELALLRHVADRGGATVSEVVEQFGAAERTGAIDRA